MGQLVHQGLHAQCTAVLAVCRRQQERGLVGVVLEAERVQRHAGVLGNALVRRAERAVLVPGQGDDACHLRRSGPVRGLRLEGGVVTYHCQGVPVTGQDAADDRGGSADRIACDLDSAWFRHTVEVVRLEASLGDERSDEELVAVERPVDDAQLLAVRTGQQGVVVKDEFGDCPLDMSAVPDLVAEGDCSLYCAWWWYWLVHTPGRRAASASAKEAKSVRWALMWSKVWSRCRGV